MQIAKNDNYRKSNTTRIIFSKIRKTLSELIKVLSLYGVKQILYTDWTASGRLYRIEEKLMNEFGPFVANTYRNHCVWNCDD
jgi:hypothetical protein